MLEKIETQDLLRYGLIPEFIGRVPVVVSLHELDESALVDILTAPKNALIKQYRMLFEIDGVGLEFDEDSLRSIARLAIDRKTGARGLRSIVESIMLEIMFEIPSRDDIKKCVVTKETVENKQNPTLVLTDASKKLKKKRRGIGILVSKLDL